MSFRGNYRSYLGGNEDQAFKAMENLIGRVTTEVLTEALQKGKAPYTLASDRCKDGVLRARAQTEKLTFEATMEKIKEHLGVF